jgi:hypothetical protein
LSGALAHKQTLDYDGRVRTPAYSITVEIVVVKELNWTRETNVDKTRARVRRLDSYLSMKS